MSFDLNKAIDLYESGLGQNAVAKLVGMPQSTLSAHFRRAGYAMRRARPIPHDIVIAGPYRDSRLIPLTQGKFAIIDIQDFALVTQFRWSAQIIKRKRLEPVFYGYRTIWSDWREKKQQRILLHRFIMNAPDGLTIDHKNHNPLDCRRSNLRPATYSQNCANRRTTSGTGYRGVYQTVNSRKHPFLVTITHKGKVHQIGRYKTAVDAAIAYDGKAKELFGEFAYLNFPEQNFDDVKEPAAA